MKSNKIKATIIGSMALVVTPFIVGNITENLDSNQVMVVQYPGGDLEVFTEPGYHYQGFGTVTKYDLRKQYSFNQSEDADHRLRLSFNDGGKATMSGVISWEFPTDREHIIQVHRKFSSMHAIDQQIIRPTLDAVAFTSGPLMSSTESAAEKRTILLQYMQDQAKNGPYLTRTIQVKVKDPLTGVEKTANAAEIVMEDGKPKREQESTANLFGINLLPMTIEAIHYDDVIEKQIKDRQDAIQSVQIAQANALRAEQDAITVAKQGEAKAAAAKWEQEAIKAQKVTEAQQKLEVAELSSKEAEQYKRQQILIGEGNAEKKRLEMEANGALDQKLEAYVKIQEAYAKAIADYSGNWVPQVITGGAGNATAGSGAQQMIDLLSVKAAKDLGIDMKVQGAEKTAR